MKAAFKEIVNKNNRVPEYLSLFVDSKLKKDAAGGAAPGKEIVHLDTQYDEILDKVISIFRYISDRDLFEKYYKRHLSVRLLQNKIQNDEAEKSFIQKLKAEFGKQFTSKIEGMFQDMKNSTEMDKRFPFIF